MQDESLDCTYLHIESLCWVLSTKPSHPAAHTSAASYRIEFNQYMVSNLVHEIHHTHTSGIHAQSTDGDMINHELNDQIRVLWDYTIDFLPKSLSVALNSTDPHPDIQLNNVSNMPEQGFIQIGSEVFWYGSIAGNTLKDVDRAQWNTISAAHVASSDATPLQSAIDMRQVRFGYGTVQLITIERK